MKKGVQYLSEQVHFSEKEATYLKVRKTENRLLSDDAVKKLPFESPHADYIKEWKMREKSHLKLMRLLRKQPEPKTILDVGCGNGWFTNLLAKEFPKSTVYGVDLNQPELEQANRLFGSGQVWFLYLDLLKTTHFPDLSFDMIFFNASIQYFPELNAILTKSKNLITAEGSIWINDSPFYKDERAQSVASERSMAYYSSQGCPEMAQYYFHHLENDLLQMGFTKKNPFSLWNKTPFSLYHFSKSSEH